MKALDLAELAGRNLREALLRNTLTTMGIAVGVASLVAMLSLGVGLQELASKRLARSGLFDTVYVTSRQNQRGFGGAARRHDSNPEESRPLDETARQQIERLPNVVEVYPEIRFTTEVSYARRKQLATVAGVPPSARSSDAFEGLQGSFFAGPEAEETILQVEFARELAGQPEALIGQTLLLRYAERGPVETPKGSGSAREGPAVGGDFGLGFSVIPREKSLRIVGILETDPGIGLGGFGRGRVFIPLQLAQRLRPVQVTELRDLMRASLSSPVPTYSSLIVRVTSAKHVPPVEDAVKQMGFLAFSLLDATQSLRRFFAILDLFLGIFGSLALAVASLGIINTLVMAILERRREIGILKALGAGDRDIRRLFFAEAGAMGLVGGALGVALGWVIGRAINFGTNVYLRRQDLPGENIWSVPWWLVTGAIGFAVLVSLMAGIYPATRAARLDPVQALRYE
jgi:putative ABC transport system permease protein